MKTLEYADLAQYVKSMPNFTQQEYNRIRKAKENYRQAGIDIETFNVETETMTVTIKITQSRLINGYILNQKQLVNRAREVFQNSPWAIKIIPVVYSLDVDDITIDWIEERMEEFGIKRKDLVKQLAIDKAALSKIFTGVTGLSKPMRALFHYYFLTYQLNRDMRDAL